MIKSFRHRGLKRFYEQGDPSLIRADMRDRIEFMLGQMDVAVSLDDLRSQLPFASITRQDAWVLGDDRESKLEANLPF